MLEPVVVHCEPPPATVAQVLSPLRNVVELAVPLPSRAVATVPVARFEALRAVRFVPEPETLVNVPAPGVVPPMAPGAAKVAPPRVVALIVPYTLPMRRTPAA